MTEIITSYHPIHRGTENPTPPKVMSAETGEKTDILGEIRKKITDIEICGQIDSHTSFIRTGDQIKNMVIEVIDKYREQEPKADVSDINVGKWIPVSERLPKESGEYLITIKDRTYLEISWFYPSDKKWSYRNAEIVAWMRLPEPYKEE